MIAIRERLRQLDLPILVFDRRWLLLAASGLLFSNLVVNVPVVERFVAPDGHLVPGTKWTLYGYHLGSTVVAALAVLIAARSRFRFTVKLHHLAGSFLLVEILLRVVIFVDVPGVSWLRNPRLYSTGDCGDNGYYVLRHYYDREPPRGEPHPLFGWVAGVGALGVITDRYFSMEDVSRRPLLFFGDSFVAWGERMDEKIPQMMGRLLPDLDVLNYGVPGYASDQIWLRFQAEYPPFAPRRPIVLIGLLLDDLDRAMLEYRMGQKPFYEIVDGKIGLRPPRFPTNEEYVDRYHFHSKSFALAPLGVVVRRLLRSEGWCSERRRAVNRAILGEMVDFIRSEDVDAHIVIFYTLNDLARSSTLERELRGILSELGFDRVIDTEAFLLPYLEQTGAAKTVLYDDGGAGHHTVEARRMIASGIADYLRRLHPELR